MSTPHFSFNDLKKHIQTFEKLKTQIYVSDEVFRTLTGFCLMIQPTFTQLRQQDDFHRFTFLKTSFLKNCTRTEKDKIFLGIFDGGIIHGWHAVWRCICRGRIKRS